MDWFKRNMAGRKIVLLIVATILLSGLFLVLFWTGYGLIFIFVMILVAMAVGLYFLWRQIQKYRYDDLLRTAFFNLYAGTMAAQFNYEAPFIIKNFENASNEFAPVGMVQGRTMLPVDETIDMVKTVDGKTVPITTKEISALLGEMGEPSTVTRQVRNEENRLEPIEEDNIIWVFRVARQGFLGKNQQLWIVADSQISDLCRDPTGDIATGHAVLAYGSPIKMGSFMILWNSDKQLERAVKGIKTVAVMAAFERYVNRLAQLTIQDVKTRQDVVIRKEANKHEEEAETE